MRRSTRWTLTLAAASVLFTAPVSAAPPQLPIERQAQAARDARLAAKRQRAQTLSQVKGLSQSPLAKLAFWRDRSLATPETQEAVAILQRYLKADGSEALVLKSGSGRLALRRNGDLVSLNTRVTFFNEQRDNYRSGVRAGDAPKNAADLATELRELSQAAQRGEKLQTTYTYSLAGHNLRSPTRLLGSILLNSGSGGEFGPDFK